MDTTEPQQQFSPAFGQNKNKREKILIKIWLAVDICVLHALLVVF
jgi:hypothetical protein